MNRILVVEDDAAVAEHVKRQLIVNGFSADVSNDGQSALMRAQQGAYSAIVLDLGLPGLDGLSVLSRWRSEGVDTPVIILTARASWVERVEGITRGADDYLPKPFRFEELLARIRAILRRSNRNGSETTRLGGLQIDRQTRTIIKGSTTVELTSLEFRLLEVLAEVPGDIINAADLLDRVYGAHHGKDTNTVERLLARLRHKIGADSIVTHRGLGYSLVTHH
jgi:two-component system, OmpR family, response regulator